MFYQYGYSKQRFSSQLAPPSSPSSWPWSWPRSWRAISTSLLRIFNTRIILCREDYPFCRKTLARLFCFIYQPKIGNYEKDNCWFIALGFYEPGNGKYRLCKLVAPPSPPSPPPSYVLGGGQAVRLYEGNTRIILVFYAWSWSFF